MKCPGRFFVVRSLRRISLAPGLLLLFFYAQPVLGQTENPNALSFNQILTLPDDTNKIKQLFGLGYTLEYSDTGLCHRVYREALRISYKVNSPLFVCKSMINLGVLHRKSGNLSLASESYEKTYIFALRNKIPEYEAKALINLGNIFFQQDDFEKALTCYLQSVPVLKSLRQDKTLSLTYGNISNVFIQQLLYSKAVEYSELAIESGLKSGDGRTIGLAYNMAASAYLRLNFREKSESLILKALPYLQKAGPIESLLDVYQQLTYQNLERGKYNLANAYADSCVALSTQINSPRMKANALLLKSRCYRENKLLNEAGATLAKAKELVLQETSWDLARNWYYEKYNLEKAKGNHQQAMEAYFRSEAYEDSLKTESVQKANLNLEKKFDTENKRLKIAGLEKENQIRSLEIKQKQRWIWITIGLALMLVLIAVLLWLNQKRKNQIAAKEKLLQAQKIRELETEKQLVALSGILEGEEKERNRLGQDLHDGLGSLLSGVKLSLGAVRKTSQLDGKVEELFDHSMQQMDRAIQEMRHIAHNLLPSALEESGLLEAVQSFVENLNQNTGLSIHLENVRFDQRLEKQKELVAFRIIQEAVNNALKHAQATQILIQIARIENQVMITIEDDGVGFDVGNTDPSKQAGLKNLQNRTNFLKGILSIQSKVGEGTSIVVEFPFD